MAIVYGAGNPSNPHPQYARIDDPIDVTGARDTAEEALANLLAALAEAGIITDSTTNT